MRLNKRDRIIKYGQLKNYSEQAIQYISFLCSLCKSGVIPGYVSKYHQLASQQIFHGDSYELKNTYIFLQKEKIIELQGMDLFILPWDDNHFYYLNYNLPRRKYSRSISQDQLSIELLLSDPRYNVVDFPDKSQNKAPENRLTVTFNWNKIIGIKVPRTLSGILTGQLTGDQEREGSEDHELSKEMIRYLCGLVSQCNSNGEILDYKKHFSIMEMRDLFEDQGCAVSTCYNVHDKLLEKGAIEVKIHPKTNTPYLKVTGYREGFGKGKNYVIIPYAVFKAAFKELETASIKLFFDLIFKLNNGEDRNSKNTGVGKVVYLKAFRTKWDTENGKAKYQETLRWLKRRCRAEILALIYGSKEGKALQEFFHLTLNNKHFRNGVIEVRIREEYFVNKKTDKYRILEDPRMKYKRKTEIIQETLQSCSFKYDDEDIKAFVRVLKKASRHVIEILLQALDIDYRTRKERNWKEIQSLGAYLYWLYEKYRAGDKLIHKKILEDPDEVFISDYEESIEEFEELYEEA